MHSLTYLHHSLTHTERKIYTKHKDTYTHNVTHTHTHKVHKSSPKDTVLYNSGTNCTISLDAKYTPDVNSRHNNQHKYSKINTKIEMLCTKCS